MVDILQNPVTGDAFFINGSTPVTFENKVSVAQKLKIKLQTFKSEWFLDTTIGVPYFQTIFQRGTSKTTIDIIFQEQILSEPEVLEIIEFNSIIDVDSATYQLSFKVRTSENQITDYVDLLIGV